MAWLFQGVLNAGLQILLSIAGGWICAKLRLVDPEILSRQLNAFAMRAAFPAFIIHLLGIKTDLRDLRAWRALAVFILWVFLIHLSCLLWHHLRRKNSNVQHLGINCLLLTTNNTGCIGWPVLIATVGRQGAALSMLLGVLFFVQLLPVAITCFEYHKYLTSHQANGAATTQPTQPGKLPTTVGPPGQEEAAPAGFPHEFRYCYWSNADYIPQKTASTDTNSNSNSTINKSSNEQAYANYLEVHVSTSSEAPEELDHHCYGGGRSTSSNNSSSSNTPTSSGGASKSSSGKEWWRSGPPKQQRQLQQSAPGLKRAKDSCDSLYTPFAAAASKEVDMAQPPQVLQSPKIKPGLTNLTRRLSGAVAAAAASAAAAPSSLVRAASLKHAASAKRAREGRCDLSVPLMAGREGPTSCQGGGSASGGSSGGSAAATAAAAAGTRTSANGGSAAAAVLSAAGKVPTEQTSKESVTANSSSAGALSGWRSRSLSGVPAGPFANAAADSCLELHTMCPEPLREENGSEMHHEKHMAQHLAGNSSIVSNNSFLSGRPDSIRINSRTGLLAALTTSSGFHKGAAAAAAGRSKLGSAAGAVGAAGAAGAAGGVASQVDLHQVPQGCFKTFIRNHPLLVHITAVQLRSFHLWLNLVAIALSVSGARKYLDPDSPVALPALGWVDGVLSWFSAACIPVLLFANGVWMVGKDVFGGRKGQLQVTLILFLKLSLFPALMVGLTKLFGLNDAYGLSLVLLTSCPLAPLAFLVCQQYNVGAELATSVTIQGVLLMLPQMMAIIKISQVAGLYDVDILNGV